MLLHRRRVNLVCSNDAVNITSTVTSYQPVQSPDHRRTRTECAGMQVRVRLRLQRWNTHTQSTQLHTQRGHTFFSGRSRHDGLSGMLCSDVFPSGPSHVS
jgi:hypothetical protein